MIRERQSQLDPEQEFLVVRNVTGVTLTRGQAVCFDALSGNANGVGVVYPYSQGVGLFAGLVHGGSGGGTTIENQAFGRILVSGFCDWALVNPGTPMIDPDVNIGDQLGPFVGETVLFRLGSALPGSEVVCMQFIPVSGGITTARVMVRARR